MEVDISSQPDSPNIHTEEKKHVPWAAIVLIIVGSILLLGKFHLVTVSYSQIVWSIVMLFGFLKVGRGFALNRRGKIFWGTIVFLVGLFFFLRSIESFDLHIYMLPSAMFFIVGAAFFMIYLTNFREVFLLILSVLFVGVGTALMLAEFGYLSHWEVWDVIHLYWPVVLILLGLGMILRRKLNVQSNQPLS